MNRSHAGFAGAALVALAVAGSAAAKSESQARQVKCEGGTSADCMFSCLSETDQPILVHAGVRRAIVSRLADRHARVDLERRPPHRPVSVLVTDADRCALSANGSRRPGRSQGLLHASGSGGGGPAGWVLLAALATTLLPVLARGSPRTG